MALKRPIRGGRPEGGAAAVEFALVMPILVLLISSIVGFGVVLAQQMALSNAVRQAARSAVVRDGLTCGDMATQARTDATTLFVTTANVNITATRRTTAGVTSSPCGVSTNKPCAGGQLDDTLIVTGTYNSTLSLPFFKPTFNLQANGSFRCEFQ
ncbi:TadE/TadG family type IV pilus assembly protein [Pedococcus bigeumensis]|uniref:TadE/TadG family type IV pilus assembly protein n=1 Tax=Pedococcus bigeumensis TaxID=433644 RepID=UPI002FE82957